MKTLIIFFFSFIIAQPVFGQQAGFWKSPVSGTWVEEIHKTDTLVFLPEYDGQHPIFQLNRGLDNGDRANLPKLYSVAYWYILTDRSISIQYFFSSTIGFQSCYFKIFPDSVKFEIANFLKEPSSKTDTLTFYRLQ